MTEPPAPDRAAGARQVTGETPPDHDHEEPDGLFGARGRRALVIVSLVGVCLLLVLVVLRVVAAPAAAPPVGQGQVRLGPESGEPVADYLARLPQTLPAPGSRALALVQFDTSLTTADAATLADSLPVQQAVFRLPIPRVQTALRFEPVPAGAPLEPALDTARQRAGYLAEVDAARLSGRQAAVARAEAAGYAQPCACVIALVVEGDRSSMERLAATPGVRALDAAPVGVTAPELALAPLLPEQTETASPLPDDGPV